MKYSFGIRADYFLPMKNGKAESQRDIFLGITGSKITAITPWRDGLEKDCAEFLHAQDQVVMPGLVNGHTHLAMTLFRGLEDDVPFHVWLFERILPLEAKFVSADFVRVGSELAALECIRFGTTTVTDMYMYCDSVADVIDRAGLRGVLSQTFASFPLPEDKDVGTNKIPVFERFHARYKNHERVTASLGPHAPYTCEDSLLKEVAALADRTGAPIQIHVSETRKEVEEARAKYRESPVERLKRLGILRKGTICAHCVHLDEADQKIMQESGASVVYNPDSNTKLGSGIAPIPSYLAKGIPVAFGTDGSASNNDLSLFGAMDLGTKIQKQALGDTTAMSAEQALRLATYEGARAIGLGNKIGSLEVGKLADLICVDLSDPHMQPVHSIASQLVYSASGLEVDTVFCNGVPLMRKKKIINTLDQAKIRKEADLYRDKIQEELRKI